jgi:hypothetical protein
MLTEEIEDRIEQFVEFLQEKKIAGKADLMKHGFSISFVNQMTYLDHRIYETDDGKIGLNLSLQK